MSDNEYTVKYWEDEESREAGISEIGDSFSDKNEAIANAKRLIDKGNAASVEVYAVENEETVIYGYDGVEEWGADFENTISKINWQDKVGEHFTLRGNENFGKYTVTAVIDNETIALKRDDGYVLEAHLPQLNADGTIEWAYSTGGYFPDKEPLTLKAFLDTGEHESIVVYNKYNEFLAEGEPEKLRQNGLWSLIDEENAVVEKSYNSVLPLQEYKTHIILGNYPLHDRPLEQLREQLTSLHENYDLSDIVDDDVRIELETLYNERVAKLQKYIELAKVSEPRKEAENLGSLWYVDENNGDIKNVWFNPDDNMGGALVESTTKADMLIKVMDDPVGHFGEPVDFYFLDFWDSVANQEKTDINSPKFNELIGRLKKDIADNKPAFTGDTEQTYKGIIDVAKKIISFKEAEKLDSLWYVNEEIGRFKNVYFNPNSDAGGMLVENVIYADDVIRGYETAGDFYSEYSVFDYINEHGKQYNTDINTPAFTEKLSALKDDVANNYYECIGDTEETMNRLIELAEIYVIGKDIPPPVAENSNVSWKTEKLEQLNNAEKVYGKESFEYEFLEHELSLSMDEYTNLYSDIKSKLIEQGYTPKDEVIGETLQSDYDYDVAVGGAAQDLLYQYTKEVDIHPFPEDLSKIMKFINAKNALTPKEALERSLSVKSYIDMDFMTELTQMNYDNLRTELATQGLAYMNLGGADSREKIYVTTEEYLSGDLHDKLNHAKASAAVSPEFSVNVEVLEKAIEKSDLRKEAEEIGSLWYTNEKTGEVKNVWFYLNDDSGGALIENTVKAEELIEIMAEAHGEFGDPLSEYFVEFYDLVAENNKITTDIDSPNFKDLLNKLKEDIADKKPTFTENTEETFKGLMDFANKIVKVQEAENLGSLWYINEETGRISNVYFNPDSDAVGTIHENIIYSGELLEVVKLMGENVAENFYSDIEESSTQYNSDIGTSDFELMLNNLKNDIEEEIFTFRGDTEETMESLIEVAVKIQKAQQQQLLKVYMKSSEYANEHGEIEQYRKSDKQNIECAAAIDNAIKTNTTYGEMAGTQWVDTEKALKSVISTYGAERVYAVTAMSVDVLKHDGRISNKNKVWASEISTPNVYWKPYLKPHAIIVDGFFDDARKIYEQARAAFFEEKGHCSLDEIYDYIGKDIAREAAHNRGDTKFEFSDEIGQLVAKNAKKSELSDLEYHKILTEVHNELKNRGILLDVAENVYQEKNYSIVPLQDLNVQDLFNDYIEKVNAHPESTDVAKIADFIEQEIKKAQQTQSTMPEEPAQNSQTGATPDGENIILTEDNLMNITARVTPIENETSLKGLATVSLGDQIDIHGVKIVEATSKENGEKYLFLSMPGEMGTNGKFYEAAVPINSEALANLKETVLTEYERTLEFGKKEKAEKSPTDVSLKVSGFKENTRDNNIKGSCNVTVGNTMVIKGVKIIETKTGELSIGMPSKMNAEGGYDSMITPRSPEFFAQVKAAVIENYHNRDNVIGNTPYHKLADQTKGEELAHKTLNSQFAEKVAEQLNADNVNWSGKISSDKTSIAVNKIDTPKLEAAIEKTKTAIQEAKAAQENPPLPEAPPANRGGRK